MKMTLPFRLLLFVGLAFASCQKEPSPQPPVNPSATDEIVAPASFNWSMINEVTVRISGLDTPAAVSGVLKISDASGVVYYQKWVSIAASQNLKVSVPSNLTQLVVSLGSISKTVPIVNGVVSTDYLADKPAVAPEV